MSYMNAQSTKSGGMINVKATPGGILLTQSPSYPYASQSLSGAGYSGVTLPAGFVLTHIMVSNSANAVVSLKITLPSGTEKTVSIPDKIIVPVNNTQSLKIAGDQLVVLFGFEV